jgi:hypothetical protein
LPHWRKARQDAATTYHEIGDANHGGSALKLDPPYKFCPNAEELHVAGDVSKNSRYGGQIPIKSFRFFHFRRKWPWLNELEIRKDFEPEKEGRKIDILAWVRKI